MVNYLLDVVFIGGVILILVTTFLRNQKRQFRNLFCFLLALAAVLCTVGFDLFGVGTMAKDLISSLGVLNYLSFIPADYLVEPYLSLLGLFVGFLAVIVVYIVIYLLSLILFGRERRRYKKYPAYATPWRPISAILVGLVKSVVYVYLVAMVVYVVTANSTAGDFFGLDVSKGIVYPLLEQYNLIFLGENLKGFVTGLF